MTRAQTRARARAHRGTARLQEHDGRERAPVDSRLLAAAHGAAPARKLKLEKTHERTISHRVCDAVKQFARSFFSMWESDSDGDGAASPIGLTLDEQAERSAERTWRTLRSVEQKVRALRALSRSKQSHEALAYLAAPSGKQ